MRYRKNSNSRLASLGRGGSRLRFVLVRGRSGLYCHCVQLFFIIYFALGHEKAGDSPLRFSIISNLNTASIPSNANAVHHVGQYPINSNRTPASIVPADVPTEAAIVTSPIACPILSEGIVSAIVAMPMTKMALLANACMKRLAKSTAARLESDHFNRAK